MKHLKLLGLAAAAATLLMSFAAGASATVLTSPAGTTYTSTVKAESPLPTMIRVHNLLQEDECASQLEWKVGSHGAGVTVKGSVTSFTVFECVEGSTITLPQLGTLEVHTKTEKADGDGVVTWTGARMTIVVHTIFGSFDCGYQIKDPFVAEITGSKGQGGLPARIDMSVEWGLVEGAVTCSKTTRFTAEYSVTSPTYLDVD